MSASHHYSHSTFGKTLDNKMFHQFSSTFNTSRNSTKNTTIQKGVSFKKPKCSLKSINDFNKYEVNNADSQKVNHVYKHTGQQKESNQLALTLSSKTSKTKASTTKSFSDYKRPRKMKYCKKITRVHPKTSFDSRAVKTARNGEHQAPVASCRLNSATKSSLKPKVCSFKSKDLVVLKSIPKRSFTFEEEYFCTESASRARGLFQEAIVNLIIQERLMHDLQICIKESRPYGELLQKWWKEVPKSFEEQYQIFNS